MDTQVSGTLAAPLLIGRDSRGVVTLTLNRPASFNALSDELLAALDAAIGAIAADADARVVVLAAAGRAFCAGHDLREMIAREDEAAHRDLFARCTRVMLGLQHLKVPVIARVQGWRRRRAASWWRAATSRWRRRARASRFRASISACSARRRVWPSPARCRARRRWRCCSPAR
ncbi:unnamed protein product [Acidocella sp. C78]|nr:unnamed protein product [Acidocella sp. C78]